MLCAALLAATRQYIASTQCERCVLHACVRGIPQACLDKRLVQGMPALPKRSGVVCGSGANLEEWGSLSQVASHWRPSNFRTLRLATKHLGRRRSCAGSPTTTGCPCPWGAVLAPAATCVPEQRVQGLLQGDGAPGDVLVLQRTLQWQGKGQTSERRGGCGSRKLATWLTTTGCPTLLPLRLVANDNVVAYTKRTPAVLQRPRTSAPR